MKADSRQELVHKLMSLSAPVTTKGASYFGISDPAQQALLDLKRVTADFADETQKANPDQTKIADLTTQIEASLQTLYALNIIDQPKLDDLLNLLHT